MKKIILGWSFGGDTGLKNAVKNISKGKALVIDVEDISAFDTKHIYIGKYFEQHKISEFTSAFIRYPYDLIPPYTKTYSSRELTEFLKTLALMFSHISVNPITHGSISRNRIYGLSIASRCGLKTPSSLAITHSISGGFKKDALSKKHITKCLGNCYFSETLSRKDYPLKKYLSFEEDGGDTAYIYPAHTVSKNKNINKHIHDFGVCFLQDFIVGDEFRMYVIKNQIFSYKRSASSREDKSADTFLNTEATLSKEDVGKILKLVKMLNLSYLCLDIIITHDLRELVIIDINPYGSLPAFALFPAPTEALAHLILEKV